MEFITELIDRHNSVDHTMDIVIAVVVVCQFCLGFILGRRWERAWPKK